MWVLAGSAVCLWVLAVVLALRNAWNRPQVRIATALRMLALACVALLVFLPTLTSSWREVRRPRLAVLVDASRSMALSHGTGPTRYAQALAGVAAVKARFAPRFDLVVRAFGFAPVEGTLPARPTAGGTDLGRALRETLRAAADDRLRGVFLFSDGRQTEKGDPLLWGRTSPVPLFVRPLGKVDGGEKDLAVSALHVPEQVFRGGRVAVDVQVGSRGFPAEAGRGVAELVVNDEVVDQQGFDLAAPEAMRFEWSPEGDGWCRVALRVPPRPDELTDGNNRAETMVWVEKEPRKVLLLGCRPMEDLAFFRRTLEADPRFRVDVALALGPGRSAELPPGRRLDDYGLVALCGYEPERMAAGLDGEIFRWVTERDGALLLFGNGPGESQALAGGPLGPILPVTAVRKRRDEDGGRRPFVLTGAGRGHPLCTVLGNPQMNEVAWRELPPVRPGVTAPEATADAKVLAHFASLPRPDVAAAYRLFGRGIVLWFNTDELWLWKLQLGSSGDPDDFHEAFCRGLAAWMSDGRRGEGLSIHADRIRYRVGETVFVRLVGASAASTLVLRPRGGEERRLDLQLRAGSVEGRFVVDVAGPWTLALADGGARPREIVAVDTPRELVDPRPDAALLAELARHSRGSVLADGPAALEGLNLDDAPETEVHRARLFWLDEGLLLAAMLLLLCGEWILRRRVNLP